MIPYCFLDILLKLRDRFAAGNAAGQIWNLGGIGSIGPGFDDHDVFHAIHFSRACFKMLFKVPGGTS